MKEIALIHSPSRLIFDCNWDIGIGGSFWTSGEILIAYWRMHAMSARELFFGKRVLELGSGTGMVGIFCAASFEPKRVILTDQSSQLAQLRANVARNSAFFKNVSVNVMELNWGDQEQLNDVTRSEFDVLVATDVAYLPELYHPLLESMEALLTKSNFLFLGLNRNDTDSSFFDELTRRNFCFYRVMEHALPMAHRGKDYGILQISRRQ